jgi:hypothetical protein
MGCSQMSYACVTPGPPVGQSKMNTFVKYLVIYLFPELVQFSRCVRTHTAASTAKIISLKMSSSQRLAMRILKETLDSSTITQFSAVKNPPVATCSNTGLFSQVEELLQNVSCSLCMRMPPSGLSTSESLLAHERWEQGCPLLAQVWHLAYVRRRENKFAGI